MGNNFVKNSYTAIFWPGSQVSSWTPSWLLLLVTSPLVRRSKYFRIRSFSLSACLSPYIRSPGIASFSLACQESLYILTMDLSEISLDKRKQLVFLDQWTFLLQRVAFSLLSDPCRNYLHVLLDFRTPFWKFSRRQEVVPDGTNQTRTTTPERICHGRNNVAKMTCPNFVLCSWNCKSFASFTSGTRINSRLEWPKMHICWQTRVFGFPRILQSDLCIELACSDFCIFCPKFNVWRHRYLHVILNRCSRQDNPMPGFHKVNTFSALCSSVLYLVTFIKDNIILETRRKHLEQEHWRHAGHRNSQTEDGKECQIWNVSPKSAVSGYPAMKFACWFGQLFAAINDQAVRSEENSALPHDSG